MMVSVLRGDINHSGLVSSHDFGGQYWLNTGFAGSSHELDASKLYDAGIGFNASNSNSIYGNSDTVQPPAISTIYLIKH